VPCCKSEHHCSSSCFCCSSNILLTVDLTTELSHVRPVKSQHEMGCLNKNMGMRTRKRMCACVRARTRGGMAKTRAILDHVSLVLGERPNEAVVRRSCALLELPRASVGGIGPVTA
jgi:hypothetical protein